MKTIFIAVMLLTISGSLKSFAAEESSNFSFDLKMHQNEPEEFQTNWKMRQERKVGIGFGIGGQFGDYGMQADLNFEDENGVVAGFGKASGYQSFNMMWKHVFEGQYITPYTVAGYTRWYNSSPGAYHGNAILDQVLPANEKQGSAFSADFITAGAGMQYYQLSGEFKGWSFYAEANLLVEARRSKLAPVASLGTLYYF